MDRDKVIEEIEIDLTDILYNLETYEDEEETPQQIESVKKAISLIKENEELRKELLDYKHWRKTASKDCNGMLLLP